MHRFAGKDPRGSFELTLGAAVVALVLIAFAPGGALAQLADAGLQLEKAQVTAALPIDVDPFCSGDRCPGQTCDEINRRCVGDVTLQPAMGAPLIGLSPEQLVRFAVGGVDFDTDISADQGLGPTFNQTACGSCHITPLGGSGTILVNRFGTLDFDTLEFDPLAELGGSLQQSQAISPECAETLPFPPANTFAQRLTNSTLGFGLVENIPDQDILFNELNPPSPNVSGRARLVGALESPGETFVGRFGWKAQVATVLTFSGDAALNEMGLTNRLVLNENAPNGNAAVLAACDAIPDPEDVPNSSGTEFIDRVTDFQRFLAPPPQTPRSGMTGEALFMQIGCGDCHLPSFTTGPVDDDEDSDTFADTVINPYSDFLVHDMGQAGDFIGDGPVGALELRTPPLWGMRRRDPLWHDGRVGGGSLAFRIKFPGGIIDQHNADGSEARVSAQAFIALSSADEDKVIAFLDSLGRREFDLDGDGDVDVFDKSSALSCAMSGLLFAPDHTCAIADADQDGDVDAADLELLDVALGIDLDDEGTDEGTDEGGDEDGDDPLTNEQLTPPEGAEVVHSNASVEDGATTPPDQTNAVEPGRNDRSSKGAGRVNRPVHRGL